jgi:ABC-type Fe3+/spermidine/putrescine transport system ATPase subunit
VTDVLVCRAVSVDYGEVRAVASLDLGVADGETLALLGPSGSGKSTLLYAVAGFLDVAEGSIELSGEAVSTPGRAVPPEKRPIGVVFQNYALWPHLTAEQTVAYPLQRAGTGKREALAQARDLLEMLGIGALAHRKPAELSGGQQQRVGLARAMARPARLYLLDEPTAHLDVSARAAVQERIAHRRREAGAAAVYATHDSAEALALADRVAIMREGSIVQMDTPRRIYERPIDLWAARLTGPASIVDVDVVGRAEGVLDVALDGTRVAAQTNDRDAGGRVRMLVRPEWVTFGGDLGGVVRDVWFRGPHTDYTIEIAAGTLDARVAGPPQARPGEHVSCTVSRGWVAVG